jgi:hypothetical protein
VGRELVDSLRNETVVRDSSGSELFSLHPIGYRESLTRALANEDLDFAETRWCDAFSSLESAPAWGGRRFGRRIVDSRCLHVPVAPDAAFRPIERLGGRTGWYYGNWLWKMRGLLDLLFGGAGLRRGRRDPRRLLAGDTVDFWRVEEVRPGRMLRLGAEMRLPGRAWLQFEVEAEGAGSVIRQTAVFDPMGVLGQLYWYVLYPIHQFMFAGMLEGIARAAGKSQ